MSEINLREATEADVSTIRSIFLEVYGEQYPYQHFLDEVWLKRAVFNDDILMLVAEDTSTKQVLGTASVVFDVGAYSDLTGEFGRLVVSSKARERGLGNLLMEARLRHIENRLHVGLVENRTQHVRSQKISLKHGFAPIGFLPVKHRFDTREHVAMFCRHFGPALALRCNHPRIIPEAYALAHMALENCGLPCDVVVDDSAQSYIATERYHVHDLHAEGYPALLRIEKGRLRQREVFGPIRLQYGFFKIAAKHANYLVAYTSKPDKIIAAAVGYIHDTFEQALRIFEIITPSPPAIRFALEELLSRATAWGCEYIEVDVSTHAPSMQRTLLELGFLPAAYVPAMVFLDVERIDVIKMVRAVNPLRFEPQLIDAVRPIYDIVRRPFALQRMAPALEEAFGTVRLFEGLNDEQRHRLAGLFRVQQLEAGEIIFETSRPATIFYLVLDGKVDIVSSCGKIVAQTSPGEALGEVAPLLERPHSTTARCRTSVTLAAMDTSDIKQLSRQRPDIGVVMYQNLAAGLGHKLRETDALLTG